MALVEIPEVRLVVVVLVVEVVEVVVEEQVVKAVGGLKVLMDHIVVEMGKLRLPVTLRPAVR